MYPRYTPYSIIKERQHQFIATVLVITLILSTTYYLFTSNQASATTTHTWDDTVTLDQTAQTDTTSGDFLTGYTLPSNFFTTTVSEEDDGEVILNQWLKYKFSTNGANGYPTLADNNVQHSFLNDGILYVSTDSGLSVINTQGTEDPSDDTLVTRYYTGSSPALERDQVLHTFLDHNLLYISTWYGGLSVINTQGTIDPGDDTLVTRYHNGSSPAVSTLVYHSFLDNNLLYISTWGSGLYVINTQGTIDPGDDTLVTRYHTGSSPALANNNVLHTFLDNDLLYISTWGGGLSVIDTHGTIDPSDDTLVNRYYTGSTPTLAHDAVRRSFLENNLLYISTYSGLSVINTQGTTDPGDDILVTRYHTGSTPALASNNVQHSFLDNNLLYISTAYGGLSVIDTKGTTNPSDDTLSILYDTDNNPFYSFLNNDLLYISVYGGGLSVINTTGKYDSLATFIGFPQSLNTVPTSSLSFTSEVTTDHSVSLAYRTGSGNSVWRNDFSTTSSYAGDLYEWGSPFGTSSAVNGVLTLSDPPDNDWTAFWFDTGYPEDHFPAGSVITARIRANISNPEASYDDWMFVDEWEWDVHYSTTNEWVTLSMVTGEDFSTIGFEPSLSVNFDTSDTFQIDWIQITTPDSFGEWKAWSSDCTNATCPIDPNDLTGNSWIQYRLDLETTNPLTTPKVLSVTYNAPATRIYTSNTETFDSTQNLLTFDVTEDTPTDTSIAYEYSIDNASTWTPVTPGATINKTSNNFTWRAILSTTDPSATPTITNVTLSTTNYTPPTSTSISKRIASLEAEGKMTEAEALRQKYTNLFISRTTSDIQMEIIKKAQEVITLLERMIRLREGE